MTVKKTFLIFLAASALSVTIFLFLNRPTEPDRTELDLYFRAVSAYERADFGLCLELTSVLSKGNRSFHQAGLLKAKAEFFSKRYEEAEESLEKLLKRKENYYEAEIWLLRCLVQLEDLDGALFLGEDILSRAPEAPRVLGILASIAAVKKDYQKAIEYRSRSILFEEELALNRIELAKIYSGLLNPQLASQQLERALELLSSESQLRQAVTELLEKTEKYK